jgi:phage nucleotide-binding protein
MMDGFTPVQDTDQYVKALIYGQPGSGKTRFCADAPKPVWFDFESSTETLRHWPEYQHIPVTRPDSIDALIRYVKKAVADPDVDTVIVDTITSALDFYMRNAAEKRASKRDKFEFWEADYKYATQVFTDLFGILQVAPINVVIIGHERIFRDGEGKIETIVPDITPRLQQAVSRLVNVVAYLTCENTQKGSLRKLYLNRTRIIEAKNRLNIQEMFLENPTWKEVF